MLLHHLVIPIIVLSCTALQLAMHLEDFSQRAFGVREWYKYWYRMAQWPLNILLGCSLAMELFLTGLLTLPPHDDGVGYQVPLYTFLGLALLGTCAVAALIVWVRNSSQLYFSSKIQSCSKTECVLCWFAYSSVWVIVIGFFWLDWVLAAKVNRYSGFALTARRNATIGEERIDFKWTAYQLACFLPVFMT